MVSGVSTDQIATNPLCTNWGYYLLLFAIVYYSRKSMMIRETKRTDKHGDLSRLTAMRTTSGRSLAE